MPKMPELPQLFEALIGSPEAESLDLSENLFDNQYQTSKYWNEGTKVNGGVDYEKEPLPTQFKDPLDSQYNDFTGTYFY